MGIYLRALTDRSPELRQASAAALGKVREPAVPMLDRLAARRELAPSVVAELRKVFTIPRPLTSWSVIGPFLISDRPPFDPGREINEAATPPGLGGEPVAWKHIQAIDDTGKIDLGQIYDHREDRSAFGAVTIDSPETRPAELLVGSDDTLTVWLGGKKVYDFKGRRSYKPAIDRVPVTLRKGVNRLAIKCGNGGGPWLFSVSVTETGDYAFLRTAGAGVSTAFNPDAFRAYALKTRGNPSHGRELFSDPKGLACNKCHTVGGQGGSVGPELSTVGAKYPRDELITSVLFPSARIFQGYEPIVIATVDGRLLTGIVKNETADVRRDRGRRDKADHDPQGPDRRAKGERRLAHAQRPGRRPEP